MCVCVCVLQAFIETYPEFKRLSGTVSKHVAVVGELSRMVSDHHMMAVSECEQEIVTSSDRNVFKVSVCVFFTQNYIWQYIHAITVLATTRASAYIHSSTHNKHNYILGACPVPI